MTPHRAKHMPAEITASGGVVQRMALQDLPVVTDQSDMRAIYTIARRSSGAAAPQRVCDVMLRRPIRAPSLQPSVFVRAGAALPCTLAKITQTR